jgi:protein-arginine kinase activator protein McsA
MSLDDFYRDLENSGYKSGSFNITELSEWTETEYTYYQSYEDENGRTYTHIETGSYSFSTYIPTHHLDIDKVIHHVKLQEQIAVKNENYEQAAKLRDRVQLIQENEDMLRKLYDLKERALRAGDYPFALEVKERIDEFLNK